MPSLEQRIKALAGNGSCRIEYNDWVGDCESVLGATPLWYLNHQWISQEEKARAILLNEVWEFKIWGSDGVCKFLGQAASLEDLIDHAEKNA